MVLVMLLLLAFCKTVFSAEQETILGIQGKGFVLLGADRSFARSIVVMKQNFSKMRALDQNKILAVSGDQSSAEVFSQIIQRNLCLEEQESGTPISTEVWISLAMETRLMESVLLPDLDPISSGLTSMGHFTGFHMELMDMHPIFFSAC
mmetsp:Transcript_12091/g.18607  ORF Transcript_12091/g.18607 Transcript_12091/m.18607 type:complete len:149 (-) Transcript_12091:457-903(-)